MQELIDELETLTGPDRGLDCLIFCATAESPFVSYYPDCVLASQGGFAARLEISDIKTYTASIDAALTLVPEGSGWLINQPRKDLMWARVFPLLGPEDGQEWGFESGDSTSTPAIALCIAALKARQQMSSMR